MSRLLRGIAIILMVTGHSLPGRVIAFAVPLFSFLVGYGYAFARTRDWRNSGRRVWHMLKYYWIIILGISLPVAWLSYPLPITAGEVVQCMFGLSPKLSFYCWFIYFYIFAMIVMPGVSRLIDRYGLKAVIGLSAICGAYMLAFDPLGLRPYHYMGILYRCLRYMPIVMTGYWLARNDVVSHLRFKPGFVAVTIALAVMVIVYLVRAWPLARIIDCIWAPVVAFAMAVVFQSYKLTAVRTVLTELGMKSMNIWFLHALFFTHATKDVFYPLVAWIKWPPAFVLAVLALSYLMAVAVDYAVKTATTRLSRKAAQITPQ